MYSNISRNFVFPFMEILQGTKIGEYLKWLNRTQWLKAEELERLQNKKLRAMIRHAFRNVPYYHRVFREIGVRPEDIRHKEDLSKIPILTKDDIRKNLGQLIAVNVPESQIIGTRSSGSTGEPLKYYLDKNSYSSGWAHTFRCWSWAGFNLGDPYVKINLNPRTHLRKKIQDRVLNCKYIYFGDIGESTLERYLMEMRGSKIVRGFASSMYVISKLIEELDINDNQIPKPLAVMTTGDTLFPHYRDKIESVFDCKIFDGYGGESTPIAFECEMHEGYHICDESVIVEFMREEETVSPGELGSIVFTNLDNYAMPFLRYNINDIGINSEDSCSCGRGLSVMNSIEGRNTDVIVTPSGKFLVVQFFTTLFKYIDGVEQFQVIQSRKDEIEIKIVKNDKFTDSDAERISSHIKKHAGEEMKVKMKFVSSIPPTKSGKRRFILSEITPF